MPATKVSKRPPAKPRAGEVSKRTPRYPDDVIEAALVTYADLGLAETARRTGVAKGTIRGWAKKAGVIAADVNARVAEKTRAATEAARVAGARALAEGREELVKAQLQIALLASLLEVEHLNASLAVAQAAKESEEGLVGGALLARLSALEAGPRLSEVVGAKTRAIHDLQLLTDRATEQPGQPGDLGFTIVLASGTPAVAQVEGRPTIIDVEATYVPPSEDDN